MIASVIRKVLKSCALKKHHTKLILNIIIIYKSPRYTCSQGSPDYKLCILACHHHLSLSISAPQRDLLSIVVIVVAA